MTSVASSVASLATGPLSTAKAAPDQREQLAAAAKQFEAIFVRQMLAAARKTDLDGQGLFDSQGAETFRQMQDDKFAETASQTGVLGLAKVIEAQIARMLPAQTTDAAIKQEAGNGI